MLERVVIIGGGVGPLTAALALGRAGHEVVVPERDPLTAHGDPSGRSVLSGGPGGPGSGAKRMGALLAAAATHPVLGRAMARLMNMLTLPAEFMPDPAVLARAAEVLSDPDGYPAPETNGPSHADLLASLAASPAA